MIDSNCFLISIVVLCRPFAWHWDVPSVGFVVLCGGPFRWTWDCCARALLAGRPDGLGGMNSCA